MITVTATAHCIGRCDWSVAGDWADIDRQAERHVKATGHPAAVVAVPGAQSRA